MIMVGYLIKKTGIIPFENIDRALAKVVPARKQDMLGANRRALELGYNYAE